VLKHLENQTVYDAWREADGLFPSETTDKRVHFVAQDGKTGFVRVRGGEEGYAGSKAKEFNVPAGCELEVFGCEIMFTRS
jgi:hypothetical protein